MHTKTALCSGVKKPSEHFLQGGMISLISYPTRKCQPEPQKGNPPIAAQVGCCCNSTCQDRVLFYGWKGFRLPLKCAAALHLHQNSSPMR